MRRVPLVLGLLTASASAHPKRVEEPKKPQPRVNIYLPPDNELHAGHGEDARSSFTYRRSKLLACYKTQLAIGPFKDKWMFRLVVARGGGRASVTFKSHGEEWVTFEKCVSKQVKEFQFIAGSSDDFAMTLAFTF